MPLIKRNFIFDHGRKIEKFRTLATSFQGSKNLKIYHYKKQGNGTINTKKVAHFHTLNPTTFVILNLHSNY